MSLFLNRGTDLSYKNAITHILYPRWLHLEADEQDFICKHIVHPSRISLDSEVSVWDISSYTNLISFLVVLSAVVRAKIMKANHITRLPLLQYDEPHVYQLAKAHMMQTKEQPCI